MNSTRTVWAETGYNDFLVGKKFNECPYTGFRPDDISHRFDWQLGWWRAEKENPKSNDNPTQT